MYTRILYFIIVSILSVTCVQAQDVVVQFQDFSKKIEQSSSIYFKSSVVIEYANEKPFEQNIIYERTPGSIYYKTTNMEMIADREISLMIYSENKKVLVQKSGKDKESKESMETAIVLSDTLLRKNDSIIYKGIINNAYTYIIYSNKKIIRKAEFSFSVADGLLRRAVYEYNPSINLGVEKTTVTFENFVLNGPVHIKKEPGSVLSVANKKYTLLPAYAGYQLINIDPTY